MRLSLKNRLFQTDSARFRLCRRVKSDRLLEKNNGICPGTCREERLDGKGVIGF